MARIAALLSFLTILGHLPKADAHSLFGVWQFTAIRYQGTEMPPPNPNLVIIYQFDDDGHNRLFWARKDEKGFCERRGLYVATQSEFLDYITWVNPKNRGDCGQDPDMHLGRLVKNTYRVADGRFELDLPLGDETLTYIWTPL